MEAHRIRGHPVILDTNSFFMPFHFGINLDAELGRLFGNYTYVIPKPVMRELRSLAESGVRHGDEALQLAEHIARSAIIFNSNLEADDAVIDAAKNVVGSILTADSELRRRARSEGIRVIYLRTGCYLRADPPL